MLIKRVSPIDQAALAEKEKMAETLQMQRAGTTVSVSMGHTRQIVGYYCGPASVQNTLAAFGVTVPSTTKSLYFYQANESASNCPYPNVNHTHYKSYTSPQITLANEMGTTYSGTDFAKLVTALNKYQRDWGYSAAHIDDTVNATNIDNLAKKVKLSLRNGRLLLCGYRQTYCSSTRERVNGLGTTSVVRRIMMRAM